MTRLILLTVLFVVAVACNQPACVGAGCNSPSPDATVGNCSNSAGRTACSGPRDPNFMCEANQYCYTAAGTVMCLAGCLTNANCPAGQFCNIPGAGSGLCRSCP